MTDPAVWGKTVHEFYTFEGAKRLAEVLEDWPGGRLVVHVTEMPIKCPVAPLEFAFLAEAYFTDKGMRDRVELVYVTPLEGAFTKPVASQRPRAHARGAQDRCSSRTSSSTGSTRTTIHAGLDGRARGSLRPARDRAAQHGRRLHRPQRASATSSTTCPVDKHTLLSKAHDNIFAVGDASDIPTSKAGSVAHFSMDLFPDNFVNHVEGRPMTELFDGHANCFIETGHGKGMLIDFNYDTEPLPGKYPVPGVGPFSLLEESRHQPPGQGRLPLDVLERAAARTSRPAAAVAHDHGGQARAR